MRCGNCGQTGHNRRTCGGGGRGYYGGGGMQPRRQPVAQAPVSTLFSCPGGRNGNSHTLYILVSNSGIAAIVPRRSNMCRGGGGTYYCPTHGCRVTRA